MAPHRYREDKDVSETTRLIATCPESSHNGCTTMTAHQWRYHHDVCWSCFINILSYKLALGYSLCVRVLLHGTLNTLSNMIPVLMCHKSSGAVKWHRLRMTWKAGSWSSCRTVYLRTLFLDLLLLGDICWQLYITHATLSAAYALTLGIKKGMHICMRVNKWAFEIL